MHLYISSSRFRHQCNRFYGLYLVMQFRYVSFRWSCFESEKNQGFPVGFRFAGRYGVLPINGPFTEGAVFFLPFPFNPITGKVPFLN